MEVLEKNLVKIGLLLWIFLVSCNQSQSSKEVTALTIDNQDLNQELIKKQKLMDKFYTELATIKSEINSIDTEDVIYAAASKSEIREQIRTDTEITTDKINQIKTLIKIQNEELELHENEINRLNRKLKELSNKSSGVDGVNQSFRQLIRSLEQELVQKSRIIIELKKENHNLQLNNVALKNSVLELKDLLQEAQKENDRKFYLVFAKKDVQLNEYFGGRISINQRSKNFEILSDHPYGSYHINEINNSRSSIELGSNFWNETKLAIIRVDKKWIN